MKAQDLLDAIEHEGSIQVGDFDIWIYTQAAIIEENGSEFAQSNPYQEEHGEINLRTAPYWWVYMEMGGYTYPIHKVEDVQFYLDELNHTCK